VQASHEHRSGAVGQRAGLLDLGDGADRGVAPVKARQQQQLAVGAAGRVSRGLGLG
jgi:hypothetical protein